MMPGTGPAQSRGTPGVLSETRLSKTAKPARNPAHRTPAARAVAARVAVAAPVAIVLNNGGHTALERQPKARRSIQRRVRTARVAPRQPGARRNRQRDPHRETQLTASLALATQRVGPNSSSRLSGMEPLPRSISTYSPK